MKLNQILLMTMLAGCCLTASAQWQWLDKEGHKVYSDRAPPSEVLDKDILKRPAARVPAAAPVSDLTETPAAIAAELPAGSSKTTELDKQVEAKKKQTLEAEAARRRAEEERIAREKNDNCSRARQSKATFESGARIGRIGENGEHEVMDDVARAAELRRIQGVIARDCR